MAEIDNLRTEIALLKQSVASQGLLIQQQRERIRRIRNTKVALVAGRFAASVDPEAESDRAKEFITEPIQVFAKMVKVLKYYRDTSNPDPTVAGKFLDSIGRG